MPRAAVSAPRPFDNMTDTTTVEAPVSTVEAVVPTDFLKPSEVAGRLRIAVVAVAIMGWPLFVSSAESQMSILGSQTGQKKESDRPSATIKIEIQEGQGQKPEEMKEPNMGQFQGITLKTVLFKTISRPNKTSAGIRKYG